MGSTPGPPGTPAPPAPPTRTLKPGTAWADAWRRCREAAPEAFADDLGVRTLWGGDWHPDGEPQPAASPVDGTSVAGPPMLDAATARRAVAASLDQHRTWRHIRPAERRARGAAALDALTEHRQLLALLLVWETGKPWKPARADVDRGIDGVRRYVDHSGTMLDGRAPLAAPVSTVSGWNHPMSVVIHTMLVQALAGNAVIAEAPAGGGLACVTLACALAVREGLPLTLFGAGGAHGTGSEDTGACLHCWGVWNYSDWEGLTPLVRTSFDEAKQRRTACSRFVVQRAQFADFLAVYLPAVRSLRYGHPLAVAHPDDVLPELDFGPLINAGKAQELADRTRDTIDRGAIPLYRGSMDQGHFLPGQDTSAYLPPTTLLSPPPSSPLHHAPPFGPVDSIVLVDTEAELLAAMDGDGALAAILCTDDQDTFDRLAPQTVPAAASDPLAPRPRDPPSRPRPQAGLRR